MFLIAASIHITRFITSRNTNRFIRKKKTIIKWGEKCTWTSENKQELYHNLHDEKKNYLWLTAFVFFSEWSSWFLVAKTYIPSSRCYKWVFLIWRLSNIRSIKRRKVQWTLKQMALYSETVHIRKINANISLHLQLFSDQTMEARFWTFKTTKRK